ncbi:MAG: hypothetical protein WA890_15295 [Micromonospora sp.]
MSPFTPTGRIRSQAWQVTMDEALAAAEAAGFRVTAHSGPSRVYAQRGLWTAATITPTPAGVVVKRSWTLAQTAALGVVLVLIVLCLGGPGMFDG